MSFWCVFSRSPTTARSRTPLTYPLLPTLFISIASQSLKAGILFTFPPFFLSSIHSLKELLSCLTGCPRMENDLFLPFGFIPLPLSQIFALTSLSFCSVNLKPFSPGHVLVIPRRPVPTLDDLTDEEMTDLMLLVKKTARMLRKVHHADAVTVSVQDGPAAGQTVPHVGYFLNDMDVNCVGACSCDSESVRRHSRRCDL